MSFWYFLLSFYWDYVDFSLGFCKLGIFWKWVGVFIFMQISFKILIRLCFIWCLCICVGPLRHFEHVLRKISLCSCILHHLCSLLHVRCLTECPSDIFVLNWTQVSSNTWILSWLIMLIMFWSVLCDVYTLGPICASLTCLAHTQHTSCISCCIPMHHMLHTHAPTHTHGHRYINHALCFSLHD